MLILTRRPGESIMIGGDIELVVLKIVGNHCKVGVRAPAAVPVHRNEVFERIAAERETEVVE